MKTAVKVPQNPQSSLVTASELAKLLNRNEATIRRWHKAGALPLALPAGHLQWKRSDLIAAGFLPEDRN